MERVPLQFRCVRSFTVRQEGFDGGTVNEVVVPKDTIWVLDEGMMEDGRKAVLFSATPNRSTPLWIEVGMKSLSRHFNPLKGSNQRASTLHQHSKLLHEIGHIITLYDTATINSKDAIENIRTIVNEQDDTNE